MFIDLYHLTPGFEVVHRRLHNTLSFDRSSGSGARRYIAPPLTQTCSSFALHGTDRVKSPSCPTDHHHDHSTTITPHVVSARLQVEKRAEIERRLEDAARREKAELRQQRSDMFAQRKRKQQEVRLIEMKMARVREVSVTQRSESGWRGPGRQRGSGSEEPSV